jgi:hypothetical protein
MKVCRLFLGCMMDALATCSLTEVLSPSESSYAAIESDYIHIAGGVYGPVSKTPDSRP